jgi:leucyl aminopeptidase
VSLPTIANVNCVASWGDGWDIVADCLVIAIGDKGIKSPGGETLDRLTDGWLSRSIESGAMKTGFGELTMMPVLPGVVTSERGPKSLLFVGLGEANKLDRGKLFDLGATITRRLSDAARERVLISFGGVLKADDADSFVAGAIAGSDGQAIHMTDSKFYSAKRIDFVGLSEESVARGKVLGDSINVTRRLVNEPPNHLYPASFADAAAAVAKEAGLECEIWDEKRLEEEQCRAILAVGAASVRPPRLVMLRHRGTDASGPLWAIVGKGVTFDSGGLSIKPSEGMLDMKCDMAGAATVVGVMRAIALLKLPINVIGLCGLAENMIGGDAYKLGDVVETRKGITVEIHNTDAEGRVVLADVLDVAVQHRPVAIVDLATLTGACMVALGRDVAGLMTNNEPLCEEIKTSAAKQGESVWQLPMFDFYGEQIKSKVADIKNVGDGRWGGAITAAKFLQRFVDDVAWVHVDIAGPAFAESAKPHRDAGATGVMLRTLVDWLGLCSAGKPE